MQKRLEFTEILKECNEIFDDYFGTPQDKPKLFFNRKSKYTKQEAKDALNRLQDAIEQYITFDAEQEKFYIDDLKFGFTYDHKNHDTVILFDSPKEYDENFQLISFELDRIFPEPLEGNWLVTTYKIVASDDTIMLYNHNENFKFDILEKIFDRSIKSMTLEDATILQYILSFIVICTEFDQEEYKDKETFIQILLDHKYDDINFYNEYDFENALTEIS